jgi:hypothetical protein
VGNEVLEDQLLNVAVLGVHVGERLQRGHPLLLGFPDPDEDSAGERDPQLPGRADRRESARRVLGRRAGMHRLHQTLGDRLEHQPLGGGHLAQPRQVLPVEYPEVGVRQDPALERALARPGHVRGEVLVAVIAQARGHGDVVFGLLAGEDEQLLDVAARGAVEDLLDLVWRMQVRLVGREGAVLAVAPAGA